MELLPPISVSLGAMVSLAGKLDALQPLDTKLKDEVMKLKARLLKLSKARDPPATVSTWINDVRELSYDMDNCVDARPREEDWIDQMQGFKARLKEANGRYDRYIPESVAVADPDHRLLIMVDGDRKHAEDPVVGLYGAGGPVDRLIQRLSHEEKKLIVVPILGAGGIGKTTLVKQIWRQRKLGDFHCRAFVRTAKKPDMRRILRSILAQVRPHRPPDANEVHDLIQELNEHLKDKRYLLIIDDLWATSVWDVASRAFPEGNHGSRIITTTEIEDVALSCCSYQSAACIFEMVTLSDSQSKDLFTSAVFRSGEQYSPLLHKVTGEIIRRCAGFPQAIICISSVVASQGDANRVQNREQILNSLPTDTTSSQILKQVIEFCYNCLPSCLQTCLLYLSLYPENYIILKEDIVKQWVAEDFILAPNKMEVAGSYFDILVSMGLIQQIDVDYSDEILYYAVHHTVHALITSKSIKENFVTVMDYSQRTGRFSNNVSRLSLQFGSATHATSPASTTTGLSQLRSLAYFGLGSCWPASVYEFKLLRSLILHIWADKPRAGAGVDLRRISELLLLRYLQVTCNDTVHLPYQLHDLKELETVDINATVGAVPSDIFHLLSLLHLRLGAGTEVPDVTGILKSATLIPPFSLDDESSSPPICSSVKTIDLFLPICRIPKWIGKFRKLSILKIVVRQLLRDDMNNMQGLPSLTVLSLYVQQRTREHTVFPTESFSALEYFEFRCGVLRLIFQKGAMPNLRRLKLGFDAGRGKQYGCSLVGFEHLSNVQEIVAIIGVAAGAEESGWEAAKTAFQKSIGNHPSSVSVIRTVMSDEEYGCPEKQKHSIIEKNPPGEQPGNEKQESRKDIKQSTDTNSQSVNRSASMVRVGEESFLVAAVGWFVSPNITRLMEIARSCTASKYKLSLDKKKNLAKLAEDLGDIKGFLHPHSMCLVNDSTWLNRLWRLKDAIHDAEEMLDLFESHVLELEAAENLKKKQHSGASSSSGSKKSTYFPWINIKRGASLGHLNKVHKNLVEIRESVRELNQDPSTRGAVLSPISREGMGPRPVRDNKLFFGYDDEYEQLVSMLRDSNTEKKVISIIGHAGMGKTELARQAFYKMKGEFHQLIWVPAYGKKTEFDVLEVIWKSAASAKSIDQIMNISGLKMELRKLFSTKKCLLVLDDVWNDEGATSELERKQAWTGLRSLVGDRCKIVITTRAKICSTTLCADASIVLNGIKPKDIKLLLNDTANLMTDSSQIRIQKLLDSQVLKFKGSPLAAEEIGKELKKQTRISARCNILTNMDQFMVSVLKGHLLTYHHLPPHLQRCFAFCSIFPYNWRFEPAKLTKMWIALGFVEESRHGLGGIMGSMEDIARGYFDSLVDRSLFQSEEASKRSSMGEGEKLYVIHEQIHWMIRLASKKNCARIYHDSTSNSASKTHIPETVRHLSVTSGCFDQLKEYSIILSNLRTLIVLKEEDDGNDPARLISAIDKDILKQFKGVRVLDLTGTGITQLPENIGKLQHVRYLGLPNTISGDLSDHVTRLLLLETLSIDDKINNTRKKRECIIANIRGIGRLVKLREPMDFQVKEGHSVWELAEMNSLQGTLSIKGLDAVPSKEEAEEACLQKKVHVKVLKLEWGPPNPQHVDDGEAASAPANNNLAVAVLEGLQPHPYLHDLTITRYPGATSPKWLGTLEKLARLYLRNCRSLQALPAMGGLPCLEILDVRELTSVEKIDDRFCGGGLFPKLKKIILHDMPKLVAWDDTPKLAFPQLREVIIIDCPLLYSLSGLGCCTGPLDLHLKGCPAITRHNLPASFSTGDSVCIFQ
uniref:Uncharacterized protein n=1 Tax=Avena sativa TaxID=4498 RepID=A0ACD5WQN9_AVESA